jgi:hypothetical protein
MSTKFHVNILLISGGNWAGLGSGRVELIWFSKIIRLRVWSGRISDFLVSGRFRFRVGSGRLSGHLMSGYFRFRVVLGRVGSIIGSSSAGLFQISGRIKLGRVGYQVI